MSNCDKVTSDADRKRLIDRKKHTKKVAYRSSSQKDMNSVIMKAIFAEKEDQCVFEDGGSDINIMPADLLARLSSAGAKMEVSMFKHARKFSLAAASNASKDPMYITCDRQVTLNTQLCIRHGKSLMLRNVHWYFAVEDVDEPHLGRPLLEALVLNTKKMLEAACDRHEGDVDMSGQFYRRRSMAEGSLVRRHTSRIFHTTGMLEDQKDIGEDDKMILDIGEDAEEDIAQALDDVIAQAAANGLSFKGQLRLRHCMGDYGDVFRIRLGNDPLAKVEPMHVKIDPKSKPFICKSRRYSKIQRKFLDKYVSKLE